MDTVQILTVVLIICASALCIALIYYINKIVKSVQSINKDLNELSSNLRPLLLSSTELFETLNKFTSEAKDQLRISKSILNDFRDRADKLLSIEDKIRSGVEETVMPLVKNMQAVGKGVETFWRNFKNK